MKTGMRPVFEVPPTNRKEMTMTWTTPAFTEMRYGFEVTMYICNR